MTRTMTFLAVFLSSVALLAADQPTPPAPSAGQLLKDGLARAGKEEKRVFLIFGSPTCGWCKYFAAYHADPEVSRLLDKHLVFVKVDIVETLWGKELYLKYGTERGVPAWTILAADRTVLADSGDGKNNVGFPAEPHEIDHYIKALQKACPKMTEEDIKLLTDRLKKTRTKQ
jgi:thiol-disulfide isomerase/thioredoxin